MEELSNFWQGEFLAVLTAMTVNDEMLAQSLAREWH
jgi:hypothetical protein